MDNRYKKSELSLHTCQDGHHKKDKRYHVDEGVEKEKPLCTVGGNVNWCSHYEKQYRGSSKS